MTESSGRASQPTTWRAAALDAYVAAAALEGAEGGALPERGPGGAAADGPGA